MPLTERSPYIRVLPGAVTLDIILKNTHFPDELLAPDAPILCSVECNAGIVVLVFQFKSPAYDFSEPMLSAEFQNSEPGWLQQERIRIRLLLANSIITDCITDTRVCFTRK